MNMERAWIPAGVSPAERRRLFSIWIRTGRIPTRRDDGVELKFNPWHDPRDGRFTSGPGGEAAARDGPPERGGEGGGVGEGGVVRSDGVYRPGEPGPTLIPIGAPEPPETRGGNMRAFEDPMTLDEWQVDEHSALGPPLRLADQIFDITGPGAEVRTALMRVQAEKILSDIHQLDPTYVFQSFQFPYSEDGQRRLIDGLRFDRAVLTMRVKGDLEPLQLETYRFAQGATNDAYQEGLRRLKLTMLPIRLSEREALGNFVDQRVREQLRQRFFLAGVDCSGAGPVRLNRNEAVGENGRFRRPDIRVGDVAFDVSLSAKTRGQAQIRGFFNANFKPSMVVIIRPSELGRSTSYILRR
ncbi:hypothetical protein [Sphingomonas phyllosphaerae]|uniref:hypothetical protein n=1 Tax=Sphingomonas phyllosphaerae TaxID=257003 RepID=UPI0024131BAD|nr:hypothetical protein [Sphingomonas phyllosphaerae]